MPKLIVLEGPDSVGKTTQIKILQNKLNAKLIVQPSNDNIVGFLRNIVKNDNSLDQSTRQALHTVSHVVDAFTEFNLDKKFEDQPVFNGVAKNYYQNIIMDRCHASTYVYGEVTGVSKSLNETLLKIHQCVYKHTLQKFDIKIIFLDRNERMEAKLTDAFESTFNWNSLREKYKEFYDMTKSNTFLFSQDETIARVDTTGLTMEEVTEEIMKVVDAD